MREYSLDHNFETSSSTKKYEETTTKTTSTTSRSDTKFKYDIVDDDEKNAVDRKDDSELEFVPVKQEKKYEIMTNEISPLAVSAFNKKKLNMFGSKPSKGFRSSSSLGYHASTSPDNFFKKKYSSEHLDKVQERVFPSKLDKMSKADLYKQIMNHYLAGGKEKKNRKRKKRLRKKHRHHKSEFKRVMLRKEHVVLHKGTCLQIY